MASKSGNKVSHLDNSYTQRLHRAEKDRNVRNAFRYRIHKKRFLVIMGIFCAGLLLVGFNLFQARRGLAEVNAQVDTSETQLTKIKATNSDLNQQVSQLNNKDYLQKLIRQKYYYSKDGETIYSFPSDKSNDVTSTK